MDNPRLRDFVQFAIEREVEAAQFYADLAGRAALPAQKTFFSEMSAVERGHEQRLREFMKTGKVKAFSRSAPADLRISDFLVEKPLTTESSPQDIFVFAMKKEQKAFELYDRLANLETDAAVKTFFLELAATEKEHKFQLEKEYEKAALGDN